MTAKKNRFSQHLGRRTIKLPGFADHEENQDTLPIQAVPTLEIKKITRSSEPTPRGLALLCLSGVQAGQLLPLRREQGSVLIGRDVNCDVYLDMLEISRRHARIVFEPDGCAYLIDFDSKNGTLVNKKPIQKHLLQVGDIIQLGNSVLLKLLYEDELNQDLDAQIQFRLFKELSESQQRSRLLERTLRKVKEQKDRIAQLNHELMEELSHSFLITTNANLQFTNLLLEQKFNPNQQELLETIQDNTSQMFWSLQERLEFNEDIKNNISARELPLPIRKSLHPVIDALQIRANKHHRELFFELDPAIPERLLGDGAHLQQILANIGDIAIQQTVENGHLFIQVKLLSMGLENQVHLQFNLSNTNPSNVTRTPLPLTTNNETNPNHKTLLKIASFLIDVMGGELQVKPTHIPGCQFSFSLYFQRELRLSSNDRLFEPFESYDALIQANLHRPTSKILIVEDDEHQQRFFQTILEENYLTEVCDNGKDAVAALQKAHYDLIFMDLQLPYLNGFEAAKAIRQFELNQHRTHTPIIAITAHNVEEYRDYCLTCGMDHFIVKPLTEEDIFSTLQTWLDVRPKVLVVDDSRVDRQLLETMLGEDEKYHLVFATNGQEAVELFRQYSGSFSLIVMDLELPILDGYEAIQTIRQQKEGQFLPILAVTGHHDQKHLSRCFEVGCSDYLTKPIHKKDLLGLFDKYLGTHVIHTHQPSPSLPQDDSVLSPNPTSDPPQSKPVAYIDPALFDLLEGYAERRKQDVEQIKAFLQEENYREIEKIGHVLKGTGSSYGIDELSLLGKKIEQAAKLHQEERILELNEQMERYLEHVQFVKKGTL